jgi:hypothetical protein
VEIAVNSAISAVHAVPAVLLEKEPKYQDILPHIDTCIKVFSGSPGVLDLLEPLLEVLWDENFGISRFFNRGDGRNRLENGGLMIAIVTIVLG